MGIEGFRIVNRPTIREEVYEFVRKRILTGEIGPGERLIEARLSEEIGTSRTPVREALHKLEMENLIYSIPRVGYVVRDITEEELEEICEIRLALEALAAKWASVRISEKEVSRLERIIHLTSICIKKNQSRSVVELDTEFHDILCRASKSQRVMEISQSLRDHMLKFRIKALCVPEVAYRSNEGHRRILDALKNKNGREIEAAVKFHLTSTKKNVISVIRSGSGKEVDSHFNEKKT